MDKQRNIELENWLIETTGKEMMGNHLGQNWNRFNEEFRFYPNISMTIADQVWEHKQKRINELQARVDEALFDMSQRKLELCESCDGYKDPVGVCQSEGLEMAINILKQALKGGEV